MDLGLFKIPAFVGLSVTAFCLAASIFAMFLYLTLYIQDNLGYGPLAAGIRFLPMTLLIFFTSFFAGRLTVRIRSRLLLGIGMLFVTAKRARKKKVEAISRARNFADCSRLFIANAPPCGRGEPRSATRKSPRRPANRRRRFTKFGPPSPRAPGP